MEELKNEVQQSAADTDAPLDKNVRLMSPTRMVVRRFFRSKLSILGLIMVIGLFLFSFLGPVFYTEWGEIELDESGKTEYATSTSTYTVNGADPRYSVDARTYTGPVALTAGDQLRAYAAAEGKYNSDVAKYNHPNT